MKNIKPSIGVVLPAYNEESIIADVTSNLRTALDKEFKGHTVKIIVVEDGSTDRTAEVLEGSKDAIVINHVINSGAGAATRTGLHLAHSLGCDYIATMDSDGQHSPVDTIRVLRAVMESDSGMVIGSRLIGSGNMPWYKRVGNKALGWITFLLLGVYASDTQSGLKAMSSEAVDKIDFHSNRYAFCSEMIWRANKANISIKEIPIQAIYTEYSISKGQKNMSGAMAIVGQLAKRRFMELLNG